MLKRLATTLLLVVVFTPAGLQLLAQSVSAPASPAGGGIPSSAGEIRGRVKSGNTPLPGVAVTAANTLTGRKVLTSTDIDGSFVLTVPSNGRYVVKAELAAFAQLTKEVMISAASRTALVDIDMVLLSRMPANAAPATSAMGGFPGSPSVMAGRRGSQPLSVRSEMDGSEAESNSAETPQNIPALAATADAGNESVAVSGNMGQTQDFGRNIDDMRERIDEMRARGDLPGGMGEPGGPAGPVMLGGPGGNGVFVTGGPGGGGFGGRGGRMGRFNINQPHGMLFYSMGNSALNAAPYALNSTNDASSAKPSYSSNRFGGTIGGPLKIPHLFDAGKNTFFFFNMFGTRATTPYQAFSHVPTLDERGLDASGAQGPAVFSQTIIDPKTGQPFLNNTIQPCASAPPGSSCLSPAALSLLKYIPPPTPGLTGPQNFLFSSAAQNDSTNIAFRIMHSFGSRPTSSRRGPGGMFGRNGVNFGLNYTNGASDLLRPFATLGGTSRGKGLNANGGYTNSRGHWTNNLRVTLNQSRTNIQNLYAGLVNVTGEAGITGVSQNPADWGVPKLSFTNFQSLTDVVPSSRRDSTFQVADNIIVRHGKHNVRFGGDFRHMTTELRSNPSPNGSFTFSGFATGNDFADFLLGYAQQTGIQYSANTYNFAADGYDLYVIDDWRVRGNLTINAGLRYEYISPFTEAHNQLVNLDVAPGLTAAVPVQPGQTGLYNGVFPASLVNPDRNNYAPRVGIAWKPFSKTVVRAGYGINYNLGQYRNIVQQMAFQPPFSITQTNAINPLLTPGWLANPLTLENGFAATTGLVTNNYGVDPNYRLGYVQIWNLNIQRDIGWGSVVNIGYAGSKGTALDMVRAPNRGPDGPTIAGVQPFLWETSQGFSILHAGSVRLRKRMKNGISLGGTYTFAKSIDDASSIGGGVTVVAQNDLDIAAERGLSSFDQRQRFTGDYSIELPFGEGRRWLNTSTGAMARMFGAWTWSGSFTMASGTPFTARVLGNVIDVANGVSGTLRANVTGQPISLPNPTVAAWFNTAAFIEPPTGQFGDAGRNTIIGPGTLVFNMSLAKSFPMKDMMNLEIRVDATNVFNTPQFTGIDTVVNSPTFGRVISVGATRQIQIATRFRF